MLRFPPLQIINDGARKSVNINVCMYSLVFSTLECRRAGATVVYLLEVYVASPFICYDEYVLRRRPGIERLCRWTLNCEVKQCRTKLMLGLARWMWNWVNTRRKHDIWQIMQRVFLCCWNERIGSASILHWELGGFIDFGVTRGWKWLYFKYNGLTL